MRSSQRGVIHLLPLLLVVAVIGTISFILISSTAPSQGLIGKLNPKPVSQAATASCTKILFPTYFENNYTTDWDAVVAAGPNVVPYALLAPHSGPGTVQEAGWLAIRNRLKTAGILAPGYIDTAATGTVANLTKPLSQVFAEIDRYESWYQPDGLFMDNALNPADVPSAINYLTQVRDYMRSHMMRPTTFVLNVGRFPDQSYINVGDILNLEATYVDWSTRAAPPSWVSQYPATRFSLMVVNATQSQMQTTFTNASSQHIGYVYVEDSPGGVTYQHIPGYWNSEVSIAQASCASITPSPKPTSLPSPTATSVPLAKPAIPTGLIATSGNGSVMLKWDANPALDKVDFYQVYEGDQNLNLNIPVSQTNYTTTVDHTGTPLVNGTGYSFRVSAHNATAYGDWSNAVTSTPIASTPVPSPTRTPAPTPTPTTCPKGPNGDANCDGAIDIFDYSLVISHFNQSGANIQGDVNKDGVVDIFDYSILVTHFGQ